MRILVTGGAGFIGSNFIRHILNKYPDYSVINLDKLTYAGNLDNLKDVENNPNYRFLKGDICDEGTVSRALRDGVEVIINFAAESHVDRSILGADSFIKTDIFGTYVLLEAARRYKIKRFIQISTDEVYGSIENGSFKETDPLGPNSPYAASKAAADILVLSYCNTYGLPVIITRSSNNFGPFQYPEKLIPLFLTNAIDDKPLPLYGDGLNIRDWLYVIDSCQAIDLILHKGKDGQIYNIGADNERTNIEITRMILKLLHKPESLIKPVKDRPGHDRRYALDCAKIKGLGWKPQYDYEEAMQETVNWYTENESWWRKIKEGKREFRQFYQKYYSRR